VFLAPALSSLLQTKPVNIEELQCSLQQAYATQHPSDSSGTSSHEGEVKSGATIST
jgi:hypothetical protein